MADEGTSVDKLQIEIIASSVEAENQINSLAAALNRLFKPGESGAETVTKKIKTIASTAAEAEARLGTGRRRAALERAIASLRPADTVDAGKIGSQLGTLDNRIARTKANIADLEETLRLVDNPRNRVSNASLIEETNKKLAEQRAILAGLIPERERLSALLLSGPKTAGEKWADIKESLTGTKLGEIVGDTGSIEEAAKRITGLDDKVSVLQVKLDGLREKLNSAFASGNVSQIATYTQQIQKLEEQIAKSSGAAESWEDIKKKFAGTKLGEIIGGTKSADEAIKRIAEIKDNATILQMKLDGVNAKLKDAFSSGNLSQIATYTAQIQKLKAQLEELGAKDSGTEKVESEESLGKKLSILQKIGDVLSSIGGTKVDFGKDFSGVVGKLASKEIKKIIPAGADTTIKALEGVVKGLTDRFLGLAAAAPAATAAVAALLAALKKMHSEMQKLSQSALSAAQAGLSFLAKQAKELSGTLSKLARDGIGKLADGIKSVGAYVAKDFVKPVTNAIKVFQTWSKALMRIAFYRVVRSALKVLSDAFKTGTDNLYQYSKLIGTDFAPAMDRLATSALYLKNSIGAMAAPLIEALAPAVDFLVDKFVLLINVIGKAFAMLTGKSVYTQAKKHAVEYADAANSASKATKKFLLGIDELTILDDPKGGAASALEDYGSMFEEVEIDQDEFDWAKKIREAIENGEWRSVGELVANKLNEVVESWDSYAWGTKLGTLLNNGLNVSYGFLTTFGFDKIGAKVAEGLNGIFDEVDFDLIGKTFAAKWNALFDFIYGFASSLHWNDIGKEIANAINGALEEIDPEGAADAVSGFVTGLFDTISTAIEQTNWDVLGDKLATFINDVDWYGAIYGGLSIITSGLSALKDGIDGFLGKWNWRGTAQEIYTSINDAWANVDWAGLGSSLGNSVITALNFATDVISHIDWAKIGRDIGSFLIGIDWVAAFGGLADAIASGINAAVDMLGGMIETMTPNLQGIAEGIAQKVNGFFESIDWAQTGQVLSDGIEAALDFMITFLEKTDWDSIGKHISEFLEKIDWDTLLTKWGQLMGEILSAKMKLIDVSGILDVGANIVKGLWDGIWAEFDASGGILGWVQRNIFDLFMGAIKGLFGIHSPSTVMRDEVGVNIVAGLLEGISMTWGSITGFFDEKVGALKEVLSMAWEEIGLAASAAWGTITENLGLAWDNIKTFASEKFTEVRDNISAAWDSVRTATEELWGNITTALGATWDNLKAAAGEKFNAIKDGISTAWENTKSSTEEKWENIGSALANTWENLKSTAGTMFENIRIAVSEKWASIKADTSEKWEKIKSTLSDAWDKMKSTAIEKLKDMKTSISEKWGDIVSDAVKWGRDLCSNLADGIRSGISKVTSAVRSVANGVRDFLHFSEPDIGPLSDFHTYMPDMLNTMAKGIRDNSYLAVNAASDLADKMSRTLGDIEPVEAKFSDPERFLPPAQPNYSAANAEANAVPARDGQGGDNMEVVNAVFAAAQQIVNAINENNDRPIHIDWGSVASGMTSMQNRQNMMYGKTLQNY